MPDYYDGPRSGLAVLRGVVHHYESAWDDDGDCFTDVFLLRPVDLGTACLALEDWFIWLRWEHAHHRGEADASTHPVLPAELSRHRHLHEALHGRLPPTGGAIVRAAAEFSTPQRREGSRGWNGLAARWTELGERNSGPHDGKAEGSP